MGGETLGSGGRPQAELARRREEDDARRELAARRAAEERAEAVLGCRFWNQNVLTFILIAQRVKISEKCQNTVVLSCILICSILFWQNSIQDLVKFAKFRENFRTKFHEN